MNSKRNTLNTHAEKIRPSARLSFCEILEAVIGSTEAECIEHCEHEKISPLALSLCKIITEILMLNPDSNITISGEVLPITLIQDIYREIRAEHLQLVIENLRNIKHEIKNKRAYMRTALYNAVFEIEIHDENLFHRTQKNDEV